MMKAGTGATLNLMKGSKENIDISNLEDDTDYFLAVRSYDERGGLSVLSNIVSFHTANYSNVPFDYSTISEALTNAELVFLAPGTYYENFWLDIDKTLVGSSPNNTNLFITEPIELSNNSSTSSGFQSIAFSSACFLNLSYIMSAQFIFLSQMP